MSKPMTTKAEWYQVMRGAIERKEFAGFQNMGDIKAAFIFAKKKGYTPEDTQQLRSLLTEYKGNKVLIFFLKLTNGHDIAVFLRGNIVPGKYGGQFLKVTPMNCIEI